MNLDRVFRTFPHLETEHLVLRQLHRDDAESLFAILSDEEVARFYDDEAFTDISQAREQIEAWDRGYDEWRVIRWGIVQRGRMWSLVPVATMGSTAGTGGLPLATSWHVPTGARGS